MALSADTQDLIGIRAYIARYPRRFIMHTLKPLDREAILRATEETRGVVTAEEHHLTGGLGGAVAELLAVERPTRLRMVGMPDVFAAVGPTGPLRERYGMSAEAIAAACRAVLVAGPAAGRRG